MANNKTGFNYWNVDTDRYQDIKIKRLKKAFSTAGIAVYDYVVNEIYRVKGCFLEWDASTAFDVADYFDLKEVLVNEIISYCGVVGLFEKGLLSGENIITSRSIQIRFVEMTIRANRNLIIIPEEYNILSEEYKIVTEEHNIKYQESNRVKKSKVKKNIIKQKSVQDDSPKDETPFSDFVPNQQFSDRKVKPPVKEEVQMYFAGAGGKAEEAARFYNHYDSIGWMKGVNPITNWRPLANTWISNGPMMDKFSNATMKNDESKESEQLQKWEQLTKRHSGN